MHAARLQSFYKSMISSKSPLRIDLEAFGARACKLNPFAGYTMSIFGYKSNIYVGPANSSTLLNPITIVT